ERAERSGSLPAGQRIKTAWDMRVEPFIPSRFFGLRNRDLRSASPLKPSLSSGFIENHHLGHEGVDVPDVSQAASCRHRAEVLPEIADVVGLVIALRE